VAFSHWLLDFIVRAADLPLVFDGSPKVELGLEYSLDSGVHWRQALAAEFGLLAVGVAIDRVTNNGRATDRTPPPRS
jgi:hypothetical protein